MQNHRLAGQTQMEEAISRFSKKWNRLDKQVGKLHKAACYFLQNEAYRCLPELLRRDWQIDVLEPLRRDWLPTTRGEMIEVNIVGRGRRDGQTVLLIGESKLQLSRKYVDKFLSHRIRKIETGGLPAFPIIIAHMESEPDVIAYAKAQGVAVYLSYQFQR